ncbi:GNAT family N-acetyltransferase [Micromonospora olivasterospora]|uniref:Acetyltransferase (GNAT) family protein n=1 Tax=Micromonospora olivasterospora TaxID=1880 RepID=A0A562IAH5_MICOL|nr:GNAT family N-acetyltransferase [Micromonospora olivasterospora]TWH68007.1 acetyltransferase (GNAT) family protein [Micromonospora olivasterospora]
MLRALRRRADLSQRELAARARIPKSTVARIESGRGGDPRFRTVERLVEAAGGRLVIGHEPPAGVAPVPGVPHDGMRDEAGRRYPAHLDVWKVEQPRDWPGAWWAEWWNLPPERWPRPLPPGTYELKRSYRDRRRWANRIRREVTVRRVTAGLPATSWRFLAELPDGQLLGELRAHERSPHLLYGDLVDAREREVVLDGVLVAGTCRRLGIGRRLVAALEVEMARTGIRAAHAVAEDDGIHLLLACGYRLQANRPWVVRLERPDERRPARPRR